jgi:hypothetical protein
MKKNMGTVDRVVRLTVVGIIIILLAMNVVAGAFAWVLAVLALVFAATSLFSFCPLYLPFKISTRKKEKE